MIPVWRRQKQIDPWSLKPGWPSLIGKAQAGERPSLRKQVDNT